MSISIRDRLARIQRQQIRDNRVVGSPDSKSKQLPEVLKAHQWRPGQSGNPGGMAPWVHELKELCAQHAPAAIREIARLSLEAIDERVRLAAGIYIANRVMGTPTEHRESLTASVTITPQKLGFDPEKLSDEEFRKMRELLQKGKVEK